MKIYLHCYYYCKDGELHVTRSANRCTPFKLVGVFLRIP